jgi:23S rRNA (uracil1939-C5)-methyltransferase
MFRNALEILPDLAKQVNPFFTLFFALRYIFSQLEMDGGMKTTFEIELTGSSFGGDCVGRLPDGKAVFVPFGIPGERVEIELTDEKKNFSRGRIRRFVQQSPKRIQARCPHFMECGGCHYQHLAYADQLILKEGIVVDQLKRIGKFENPPVNTIIGSPVEWNYRNTVQFHLSPMGKLGYQRAGANGVVEIRECHLPLPPINTLWPRLELESEAGIQRVSIRCGSDEELLAGLESDRPQPPEFEVDFPISVVFLGPEDTLLLSGEDYSLMQVLSRTFRVSAASFFQVNLPQAEAMVNHVLEHIQLPKNATVVDAYCGAGLFSAFLAPKVKELIGIELSESACNDFAANLDEFENVSLYVGAVEEVLPALKLKPDVVLLDPPRAGLEGAALAGLVESAPQQIIYVSCDPSTLARDLRKLTDAGYTLKSVTPFDLFPQTYHVETISLLEKP